MNSRSFFAFGRWISILSRYGHMYGSRHLRQYGVGPGQLPFLMHLYEQDGVTPDQLSKQIVVDKATTTRALMALEESGLVRRVPDEEDRRSKRVYLTERAVQVKPDIRAALDLWGEVLTSKLTEAEAIQLEELMKKMAASAVEYLDHRDALHAASDTSIQDRTERSSDK